MTATVRTAGAELTIDGTKLISDDMATQIMAESYVLRRFGRAPLYDPDPDWTLAQELAIELDGLATPGEQIEYTEEDRDRIY